MDLSGRLYVLDVIIKEKVFCIIAFYGFFHQFDMVAISSKLVVLEGTAVPSLIPI